MTESSRDRAIGRLEGKLDALVEANRLASESRARMHNELEVIRIDVQALKNDFRRLDERVASIEPGVHDYLKTRQQVEGAGKLGRFLWWLGGLILGAAASAASYFTWFAGRH